MAKRNRKVTDTNVAELPILKHGLRLKNIEPMTLNQERFSEAYHRGDHCFVHGYAGTGKTFLALAFALRDVLVTQRYEKIVIVRSAVPTRDMGFMPGRADEKMKMYEAPYEFICNDLTQHVAGYDVLKQRGMVEFISTSFIRGATIENTVIIVDEASNMNFHELDSLVTRLGQNSKIIFCGDFHQSDLTKDSDKNGFLEFMYILKTMQGVSWIEMGVDDIVRSKFVKSYILAKHAYQSPTPVRARDVSKPRNRRRDD